MATMFVRQPIPNYEQWKAVFDTMEPARKEYGLTVKGIYRLVDDPNVIFLVLDCENLERAKAFAKSTVLDKGRAQALEGGRVQADVWFSDDTMDVV